LVIRNSGKVVRRDVFRCGRDSDLSPTGYGSEGSACCGGCFGLTIEVLGCYLWGGEDLLSDENSCNGQKGGAHFLSFLKRNKQSSGLLCGCEVRANIGKPGRRLLETFSEYLKKELCSKYIPPLSRHPAHARNGQSRANSPLFIIIFSFFPCHAIFFCLRFVRGPSSMQ